VARQSSLAFDFTWHLVGSDGAYKFYTDYEGYYLGYNAGEDQMTISNIGGAWASSATIFTTTSPVDPRLTSLYVIS
jgi:hypothetical protein